MNSGQRIQGFLDQLQAVLTTTIETPVSVAPAAMSASGWRVTISDGDGKVLTATFDADGAAALARVLASPDAGDEAAPVATTLQELCTHVVAASAAERQGQSATPEVSTAERVSWTATRGETVAGFRSTALPAPLVVAVAVSDGATASAPSSGTKGLPAEDDRFGVLLDIDLPLVVRFGCADMPLKALSSLGPGSVIDLSRAPDEPVEVLVGGRVVAHAEVVVVEGSYGIRIVNLVGRGEPARLEA
jgi:flagellar motor switch protein FliN/FliY